jgi:hypothetical protein
VFATVSDVQPNLIFQCKARSLPIYGVPKVPLPGLAPTLPTRLVVVIESDKHSSLLKYRTINDLNSYKNKRL